MSNRICPLSQVALTHPNYLLVDGSTSFTYAQMDQYANQLSLFLKSFPKQSVLATKIDNPCFVIALLFACLRNQQIVFPISSRLPSPFIKSKLKEIKAAHFFEQSLEIAQLNHPHKKHEINGALPFTYLLTSGSTSSPKICVHSFDNHFYSAQGSNSHLNYKEGDRWLLSLPLNHVSGLSLIFRTVLAQATLVIPKTSIEESLNNDRLTHISFIPTQLQRLIKLNSLKKLSCILLGGASIPSHLLEKAKGLGLPVYTTYGLTEMSSQVITCVVNGYLKKQSLLPFRELKIGKNKEIFVRGKCLFLGYLEKENLDKPFDSEGWYATGDLVDYKEGQLTYLGRQDNLFISGGENIQPEEIEACLLRYPGIEEALILPKPDEEFGHRPLALLKSISPIDQNLLETYLLKHLPKYKVPIEYKPLEYLGIKPSRKKLADLYFN